MSNEPSAQTASAANVAYWDELCGTSLARSLGITDNSPASLARFDEWYFKLYPYLDHYIPYVDMSGKDVLEVGLGYGSVAQRIAEHGARYQGLDIAGGPVGMVNHRLTLHQLAGTARQGNVLECPFPDESFDYVVAIGCYHHTGDVQRALDETWRVLRPGGLAVVMVYYAYSYRRCLRWPRTTLNHWRWDRHGDGLPPLPGETQRRAYDATSAGEAAPETAFLSRRHLRRVAHRYSKVDCWVENAGGERLLAFVPRPVQLATLGKVAGLDLYSHLVK